MSKKKKTKKTSCPFASSKKAKKIKIWGDKAVQRLTSEVFGSKRPWVVFLTKKNGYRSSAVVVGLLSVMRHFQSISSSLKCLV